MIHNNYKLLKKIIADEKQVETVYKPSELSFQKGNGCYLLDQNGKKFLDFSSGIGVYILGYNHHHLTTAFKESADNCFEKIILNS